ncbi:PEP-CTERM sorting domain-containing protein [Rheinheimera sp. MMS21-TC3]|uniref:PEP-CTERM sorting domain-containing protein n=1 Tax=Rheinheimera sp. MMS21-TC3 TaxID=3072790 RepID=UPI0028C4C9E8|nr:PEP-CTERM sorting domain-containing protein [Rheinheimera sp. MMS21-TC3]WNO60195.1 PEP-CTERM sorting domain-containing protein [Rheinheimera sp. MMS21-TC3]
MIQKSIFILMLTIFSFALMPQSAQAGPILSQELLIDDPDGPVSIGFLSIDIDHIIDGEVMQWQTFNLFGIDIVNSFGFFADYNEFDLNTGFTFLNFDVSDFSNSIAFQGFWDLDLGLGFLDVFTADADFLFADSFFLGPVTAASPVSEPATAFLFLIAAGGLLMRRRFNS